MKYSSCKIFVFVLLAGISVQFVSCQQTSRRNPDNALARVGNKYLTVQDARENIPAFVLKEDTASALRHYREEWIRQQLLLQEANRLDLAQKKEVRQKLQDARNEVLREALKDYVIQNKESDLKVSDDEARAYYQAHKEQFQLKEDFVQFRHMKTKTLKAARAARQDLLGGVPWPEVARKYALDPEIAINESKQYWPISMAAKGIDIMHRYLTIIGQSEISPIQRVNGIYHFVQLMEKRSEGDQPDLEWLIGQIKDWMVMNKRRRNFSSYTKNLYLKAQSNNEVETFNVVPSQSNRKSTPKDTLESNSANE